MNDTRPQMNGPLVDIEDLTTCFYSMDGVAKAVDGVSFGVNPKEVLGLVGESGCGKSVTALSILRLIREPGRIESGRILFKDRDLLKLPAKEMRALRGDRISMIFQEPMTSLNPVHRIGKQISEVTIKHRGYSKREGLNQAIEILRRVRIPSPEKRVYEYPHQLSGGMRQRVMIAMALSCRPDLLIADEPTTALDVTIQAQIMELILKLQDDFQTAIMLITHDLGLISKTAHRIVVMYAGKVVEMGMAAEIFKETAHPYTECLLQSVPVIGRRTREKRTRLREIAGTIPSLLQLPTGCLFHLRCPNAQEICREEKPPAYTLSDSHHAWCHFTGKLQNGN
jgi:peptide/nickel transport system ATP-binding protein/oligopeptide transport system ATP-binding protein